MFTCSCSNINWARRNTCNVCNAPKIAEQEPRTGFGGGYFERDNVEYKSDREDDDEYDEVWYSYISIVCFLI